MCTWMESSWQDYLFTKSAFFLTGHFSDAGSHYSFKSYSWLCRISIVRLIDFPKRVFSGGMSIFYSNA